MRQTKNKFAQAELKLIYKRAINPVKITNGNEAYSYFKSIWDKELINIQEQFYVLFLNKAKEVICWRCLHTGTMSEALVDMKLIFALAYGCLASSFIVAHNHPSGYVNPTQADFILTKELTGVAKLLGFNFIDHLVIGNSQYYSFLSKAQVGDFVLDVVS